VIPALSLFSFVFTSKEKGEGEGREDDDGNEFCRRSIVYLTSSRLSLVVTVSTRCRQKGKRKKEKGGPQSDLEPPSVVVLASADVRSKRKRGEKGGGGGGRLECGQSFRLCWTSIASPRWPIARKKKGWGGSGRGKTVSA